MSAANAVPTLASFTAAAAAVMAAAMPSTDLCLEGDSPTAQLSAELRAYRLLHSERTRYPDSVPHALLMLQGDVGNASTAAGSCGSEVHLSVARES